MTSHRTYHVDGVAIIVVAEAATMMAVAAKTMKSGDDIILAVIITIIGDEDMVNPRTEDRIATSTTGNEPRRKRRSIAVASIIDLVLVTTIRGDEYDNMK